MDAPDRTADIEGITSYLFKPQDTPEELFQTLSASEIDESSAAAQEIAKQVDDLYGVATVTGVLDDGSGVTTVAQRGGVVDQVEFRDAVRALGYDAPNAELDALFRSFDEDGSGEISYRELHRALRQLRHRLHLYAEGGESDERERNAKIPRAGEAPRAR